MDCDYDECDCDDCCFSSERGRGTQGPNGPPAIDAIGPQGFVGPEYTAPQGARGPQGTECCDQEMLRGPQGDQGPQGQNIDGFQGPVGSQGSTTPSSEGAQGLVGFDGAQGRSEIGVQGFQGIAIRGPQGPQGAVGTSSQGAIGPQGIMLSGMYIAPNPINLPAANSGTIASFLPPGPGKYLCTICFEMVMEILFPSWQTFTFSVLQNANVLTTNSADIYPGDNNNRKTLIVFDVITLDTPTLPILVTYQSPDVCAPTIFDFVATSVQIIQ